MWHVKPFDTGTDNETGNGTTGGYTNKMDLTWRLVLPWTPPLCFSLNLYFPSSFWIGMWSNAGLWSPQNWDSELRKYNKGIIVGLLSLSELWCTRRLTESNVDVRCCELKVTCVMQGGTVRTSKGCHVPDVEKVGMQMEAVGEPGSVSNPIRGHHMLLQPGSGVWLSHWDTRATHGSGAI